VLVSSTGLIVTWMFPLLIALYFAMIALLNKYQHMSEIIRTFLKNQGFNEKDVQVYLDVFRHDQSFASSTALRTGIDRTTVYSVLKRLVKKGVLVEVTINDVASYMPVSPEIFLQEIDHKVDELKAQKKIANLFVDQLQGLKKSVFDKPDIKIYEGVESVTALYERTLVKNGLQKVFTSLDSLPKGMSDFLKKRFIELKLKKGVVSKVIVDDTKFSKRYKSLDLTSNRKTVVVKNYPLDLHSEVILYGEQKVAIIDFHKQIYGIVIESATLYKSLEALFDYIWKTEIKSQT
jgi:sugar-specific transcriptional regulator TrmB